MTDTAIVDFHAHIYFEPMEIGRAKGLASAVQDRFGIAVGQFHDRSVGPHPRGSVQLTVPVEKFGDVATWLSVNRDGLTIFAHASTGDHVADHSRNIIWFG